MNRPWRYSCNSISVIKIRLQIFSLTSKVHDHSFQLIACTGQVSIASWQLQVPQFSGPITWDFSSSILKTFGHSSAQWPQPMQRSSST
jgi:hypothetical protein